MPISPILKHRAKQTLSALGIRVRPGYPVRRGLGGFCRYLARQHGYCPGCILDVGVADGTIELYAPFPEARLLMVEPVAEFEPALKALAARYGGEYVLAAASDAEGTASISVPADAHASSLADDTSGGRTIRTIRLDEEVRRRGLPPPYFIKAHTQGSELKVVAGAEGILAETDVLVLETSLFEGASKRPVLTDVAAAMRDRGFALYDLFGGHGRPLDGALAQIDAAFVHEDGRFREEHAYISKAQAEANANHWLTKLRRRPRV